MKIGIAVTTHNRPEVAEETFAAINKFRPENSIIIIVDDNGCPPFGGYGETENVFKFRQHVGVGVAKNKCLELLHDAGCTQFFLFDDDCRPVVSYWWQYYTSSLLEHATWTFNRPLISDVENKYREFEKPNGCMMYFTRNAVNTIGGWDLSFTGYGYEHVNVSDRAFNAGLTPRRYVDVWHDASPFAVVNCESSFTYDDRTRIPANMKLYQQKYYSKEFKPFK